MEALTNQNHVFCAESLFNNKTVIKKPIKSFMQPAPDLYIKLRSELGRRRTEQAEIYAWPRRESNPRIGPQYSANWATRSGRF